MTSFNDSRKSPFLYFQWRKSRTFEAFRRVKRLTAFSGKQVLDVGCGYGSLISNLLENGALVRATETDEKAIGKAQQFLKGKKGFKIIKVDDEKLPFGDNTFDVVFAVDVLEHVRKPNVLISEISRVLKRGGILYVEFTPYYSVTGHHLYDFTKLPIHMLPKKVIKKIVFSGKNRSNLVKESWDVFLSLNRIKIGKFRESIRRFDVLEERFILKYPDKFEINIPFVRFLGPLGDIFTNSFEGIYLKK